MFYFEYGGSFQSVSAVLRVIGERTADARHAMGAANVCFISVVRSRCRFLSKEGSDENLIGDEDGLPFPYTLGFVYRGDMCDYGDGKFVMCFSAETSL